MMPTGRPTAARTRCAVVLVAIALGTLLAGCGDNDVDPQATRDTVEESAGDAREQAENAFASLRTDAERLLDQFQTRNAPEAKQQLLDHCRDVLERLRRANSKNVDRVESICDRIRDTDPANSSTWREVRDEINKLREN
jgi:nucleotidyltransferase/DNA polymerase involved in DNA repair